MFTLHHRTTRPRRQRGVSLLFALIALAALSLASVALLRSVDTGAQVIGNLGFKQDATSASDRATELAIAWIQANPASLSANSPPGYYATSLDSLDPTGRVTSAANKLALIDWDLDDCASMPAGTYTTCNLLASAQVTVGGNSAKYLISRLCPATGAQGVSNACAKPVGAALTDAVSRGRVEVGQELRVSNLSTSPYYRIIVRTVGGRNSVAFTETIVHF